MRTTKEQRAVLKTYLAQFSAGTAKEAALMIDDLDSAEERIKILEEALKKYRLAMLTVEAQMCIRPEWFFGAWKRQMENILGDATEALTKSNEIGEGVGE